MTIEKVIQILDPETRREALREIPVMERIAVDQEACRIAVAVLRAKLDRSRREGCEHCKGDLEGYTSCFRDANGRSRKIYIPEGEAAIVIPGKYNHQFYIPIKFCPFCGHPLTEDTGLEPEEIKALLAEREAAVRDLTEACEDNPDVCHLCKHQPCAQKYGRCIGWEWRGPTPPDRRQAES